MPVPLPDGRILLMKGSADRVDRAGDAIVVVDYKTGSAARVRQASARTTRRSAAPSCNCRSTAWPPGSRSARPTPTSRPSTGSCTRRPGSRVELPLTADVEGAFLEAVTVIADGIAGGLFPHRPPDDDGWGDHIPCRYCDPDGLGAGEHRERWERKRHDPRLAGYLRDDSAARAMTLDRRRRPPVDPRRTWTQTLFVEAGAGSGKTTVAGRPGRRRWC